jgi:hypothetical protein
MNLHALPATDKRQGRALHLHPASRMGLRRHLRIKHRLALALQPSQATLSPRPPTPVSSTNLLGSYT